MLSGQVCEEKVNLMTMSVTLFEGIVLLFITGVFGVIWWGVKRLVKLNDDESKRLENIDKNLSKIFERIGKTETWMEMHTREDDVRHEEVKRIYTDIKQQIGKLSNH
jgi:predicted transcriptional regulator